MRRRFKDYEVIEKIADKEQLEEAIRTLAVESEDLYGMPGIAMIGIQTGGVYVAHKINEEREKLGLEPLPIGILDITLYRDDLLTGKDQPQIRTTNIPFTLDKRPILLVDDVLYTGRTVRAALDCLTDFGRPAFIKLLVVVDRDAKEYPICADLAPIKIRKQQRDQVVRVQFKEQGFDEDAIVVYKRKEL